MKTFHGKFESHQEETNEVDGRNVINFKAALKRKLFDSMHSLKNFQFELQKISEGFSVLRFSGLMKTLVRLIRVSSFRMRILFKYVDLA